MVTAIESLPLRGNDLAVDFANTVADVRTGRGEYLPTPHDLARWGRHAGALDAAELRLVLASIRSHPTVAMRVHRRALALRTNLTRILTGRGQTVDVLALDRERLHTAERHLLAAKGSGYTLAWKGAPSLELVIARVAEAAIALVASDRLASVKQCDGQRCGWLFVDESRTRARRWCSMQDCGNRAKVRSFRQRQVS